MNWQEPCIVVSPHWSLRLGPAVHLLRRWCGDHNSLLILEGGLDPELALLPFKPMAMKVLQCSFVSGIRLQNFQPLLEILQPKSVLLPKDLKQVSLSVENSFSLLCYSESETLQVASLKEGSEVEIAMDLVTQFYFKKLKQVDINVTRLHGELFVNHGKHRLLSGSKQESLKSRPLLHWGSPDKDSLLTALSRMDIKATVGRIESYSESENTYVVNIHEPSKALIEVQATNTVVIAANESLASAIFEAIDHVVDCI